MAKINRTNTAKSDLPFWVAHPHIAHTLQKRVNPLPPSPLPPVCRGVFMVNLPGMREF